MPIMRCHVLHHRTRKSAVETLEYRHLLSVAPIAVDDLIEVAEDQASKISSEDGVLANDSDADGDPLTAVLVQGPRRGEFTFRADGGFNYVPRPDFWGVDSFTYRAQDAGLQSNVALVTLLVLPRNDAPTGVADEYRVDVDGVFSTTACQGVVVNDGDPDGDRLAAVLESPPLHGVLRLVGDGSFEYEPSAGFHGLDAFTYRADDGEFVSAPTTVHIVVNTLPIAGSDSFQVAEDQSLGVAAPGLLSNDVDTDGDALAIELTARPASGDVFVSADGAFVYSPYPDFHGDDVFTYRAFDGYHYTAPVTVSLHVTSVPDPPVPTADHFVTTEDQSLQAPFVRRSASIQSRVRRLPLAANDLVYDDFSERIYASVPAAGEEDDRVAVIDPLTGTVERSIPVGNGPSRLAVSDDGRYLYVGLDADRALSRIDLAAGEVEFTIPLGTEYVEDMAALPGHPGSVAVALGDFNWFPNHRTIAVFDGEVRRALDYFDTRGGNVMTFGESIGSLYTFSNQTSEFYLHTLAIASEGVVHVQSAFNLLAGNGLDIESAGGRVFSTSGRVVSPSAQTIVANLGISGPLEVDADRNRVYYLVGEGPNRALRAFNATTLASIGAVSLSEITGQVGSLIRYGAHGLAFRANNAELVLVDTDLVTAESAYGVLDNDDPREAVNLTAAVVVQPAHGDVRMEVDGTFVYVPDDGYIGQDSFQYEARSENFPPQPVTVTIHVVPANRPPVASGDNLTVNEDEALEVPSPGVLDNDVDLDAGDALIARLVTLPAHGTLTLAADGSVHYEPQENYFGPDSFTYQASDGLRLSPVATVSIEVRPVNDPPRAEPDFYSLARGATIEADLHAPPSDALLDVRELPFSASLLTYDRGRAVIYAGTAPSEPDGNSIAAVDPTTGEIVRRVPIGGAAGAAAMSDDGQYLYYSVIAADRVRRLRLDSFTIDPVFEIQVNSVVALAVMPGHPETIAVGQYATCCGGQDGVQIYDRGVPRPLRDHQRVLALGFDDSGTQLYVSSVFSDFLAYDVVSTGIVFRTVSRNVIVGEFAYEDGLLYAPHGAVVDGYRLNPVGQYSGLPPYQGRLLPISARNRVMAIGTTSSPFYSADIVAFDADSFLEVGRVRIPNTNDYIVDALLWGDDGVAYTTSTGQFYLVRTSLIPPVHDARVVANDLEIEGQPLSIDVVTPPAHGEFTWSADGSFRYVPDVFFAGTDEFYYVVSDGESTSTPTPVTLEVRPGDLPPLGNAETYAVTEDALLAVVAGSGLLVNDVGFNGGQLTARLAIPPRDGTLTIQLDGGFSYLPRPNWSGTDRFAYRAVDGIYDSLLTWVTLEVAPSNDSPAVRDDGYRIAKDEMLHVTLPQYADAWGDTEILVHDRDRIVRYNPSQGTFKDVFIQAPAEFSLSEAHMMYGPDGNLYLTATSSRFVHRFDGRSGAYLGPFTTDFLLSTPFSLAFGPSGDLFVADFGTHQIVRFDGETGAYIGRFDSGADYTNPSDLTFSSDGTLYVTSLSHFRLMRFDGETGEFLGDLTPGILLDRPFAFTLAPNGDAYVATEGRYILHYDGSSGRLLNQFGQQNLEFPRDIEFGLDGRLYVADLELGVKAFDPVTGAYLGTPVSLGTATNSFVIDPWSIPAVGLLANDRDEEGDLLEIALDRPPRFGTLALNDDGTFRYLPDPGFEGVDTFQYHVHDGTVPSAPATVRIVVGNPPVRVPGDTNQDGVVDLVDLNNVRNTFGATSGDLAGDANDDGVVDLQDLNDVRNNFGTASDTAFATPSTPREVSHEMPQRPMHSALHAPRTTNVAPQSIDFRTWDAALERYGVEPVEWPWTVRRSRSRSPR